jgi:hypothetical protein
MSFWDSVTSWLAGTETQAVQDERYQALSSRYNEALQSKIDSGTIDPGVAAIDRQYAANNAASGGNQTDAYNQGFVEGAQDGLNNVLAAPGNAISGGGSIVGKILGNIPWWFWLLLLIGAFLYLGGGLVLRAQASKLVRKYS